MGVNDRMAQDSVKPCHHAFGILGRVVGTNSFKKAFLDDIRRELGIASAGADKAEKGIEVVENGAAVHEGWQERSEEFAKLGGNPV